MPRIPGYLLLEVVAWAAWVPTAPAQGRAGTPGGQVGILPGGQPCGWRARFFFSNLYGLYLT